MTKMNIIYISMVAKECLKYHKHAKYLIKILRICIAPK